MKNMFDLILNKLGTIDGRLDAIDQRLDAMDQRLDAMDQRIFSLERRQDEIFEVVKAIEHSNQVFKAEMDSVNLRISHVEGTLNAVGETINKRKIV